jgi:hypothetical protein
VIEAREQRDATVQEASGKVEAMKKECDGIPGSFLMSYVFKFHLQLTCFWLPGLALCVEKQKLSKGIEEMKILVRNNHNRAKEEITHAKEELALTKLIRCGADRDLVQVQKTIEVLTGTLATATENWNALWKSFHLVADLL